MYALISMMISFFLHVSIQFYMTLLESMTFDFEQNIQMILEGLTYCVATTERCFHLTPNI